MNIAAVFLGTGVLGVASHPIAVAAPSLAQDVGATNTASTASARSRLCR